MEAERTHSGWEVVWLFISNTEARAQMLSVFQEVAAAPEGASILLLMVFMFIVTTLLPFLFIAGVIWYFWYQAKKVFAQLDPQNLEALHKLHMEALAKDKNNRPSQ